MQQFKNKCCGVICERMMERSERKDLQVSMRAHIDMLCAGAMVARTMGKVGGGGVIPGTVNGTRSPRAGTTL